VAPESTVPPTVLQQVPNASFAQLANGLVPPKLLCARIALLAPGLLRLALMSSPPASYAWTVSVCENK